MYFKTLELIGFKSFADKTVLHFEPGVTAVVGPNGCGKSNIFDAIRWVLGEQSVKAMRGSSMEDVIFNGTANKPALGFAEVSLTFSNENKLFPVDYGEITITRRLFRSGESEYLMNKNQVRLKDINELLMGTGVASESYSLVEQGKIDLVLSSRPEERRSIFDEAAGITKYKSKKREALNKLKDTEENLLRLSDIIDEVKRQIGSVERQAAKARRYQEHFDRLKGLEVKMALHGLAQFNAELENLGVEKEANKAKLKELEAAIGLCTREMGDIGLELNEVILSIESCDKEALMADNSVGRLTDQIKVSKERIQEHEKRNEGLLKEKEQINKRIEDEKARSSKIKNDLASFDSQGSEKQKQLKIKNESLEVIAKNIEAARQVIAQSRKQILEATNQLSITRNESLKLNNDLSTISARRRRLQIEDAKVREEKQQSDVNCQGKQTGLKEIGSRLNSLRTDLNNKRESLKVGQDMLCDVEANINKLDKEFLNLQSHKEFLLSLKTRYSQMPDTSKAVILLDVEGLKDGMAILGKIDTVSDALDLGKDFGNSTKSIKRLQCQLKVIDLDVEKIEKKEAEVLIGLSHVKAKRDDLTEQISESSKMISLQELELRENEIAFSNMQTQVGIIEEGTNKLAEELAIVGEELGEVNSEALSLEDSLGKTKVKLDNLETGLKNLENAITLNQDNIASLTQERENTLVEITQLQTSFASMADNRLALENSIRIMESSLIQDMEKAKDSDRQVEDSRQRIEQLSSWIIQLEKEIEGAKVSKEQAFEKLESLKKGKDSFNHKAREKQAQVNEYNSTMDFTRQAEFSLTSREQEINYKILNLKNRMDATYHLNLQGPQYQPCALSEQDCTALQEEVGPLKEKLDSYGTVNLVAIEEYEELKKRFEFLTNQQNDLIAAKDSIHQAIAKINQTTRKMFIQTFEKIQENFKAYFRLLFNGGDAQLFLIDENDVLESGIEIICRPPGKKLQNISLLSGGEKSLSAIALVFAVFKVKPSPFCVLDEIDAALDESNIDRYNRVLHEFLKTTQFIIITHNKKTITNADVMYGITMQESGVSKVVSVKFAKEKSGEKVSSFKVAHAKEHHTKEHSAKEPIDEPREKEPSVLEEK